MTSSKHRMLVVEDDEPTRDELTQLLRSLDFDVVGCGDKETALQKVKGQAFCMALVDLEVFEKPGAIKAYQIHGRSLVREIRTAHPERHGIGHRFPILVVSGYAREGTEVREVMREGASDIVWKLASGGLAAELSRTIQGQLRASGREDHADCCLTPLELSIPGDRAARKTKVMLGARSAYLTDGNLRVLLYVIKGKLKGVHVHNHDMGFNGVGGNRWPSEVNRAMRDTFPVDVEEIIENHYHGNYSLIDGVTIGEIAYHRLVAIEDTKIATLAREIQRLRATSAGNS
jgi:CheY-like chemotaxis protein